MTRRLSLSVSTLATDQNVPNTGSVFPLCKTEIALRDFKTLSENDSGWGWYILTTVPSSVVKLRGQSCCCCCGAGFCARATTDTKRTAVSKENIIRMLLIRYVYLSLTRFSSLLGGTNW